MKLFSSVRGAGFWRGLLKRPSSWLLLAAGLLYLLQLLPFPGILLMFFGAGLITGTLLLLAGVAFLVESLLGFVPRALALGPLGLVAWYYCALAADQLRLPGVAAALGLRAPQPVLAYDPDKYILGSFSLDLMVRYQVPAVYSASNNNIRTVGETRHCELLNYRGDKRNTPGVPLGIRVPSLNKYFCFSDNEATATPTGVITFDWRYATREFEGIKATITTQTVEVDGLERGSFDVATVNLLKPLPMLFVGCGLLDHPAAWVCSAEFARESVRLEPDGRTQPAFDGMVEKIISGANDMESAGRIAKALSLTPRTEAEIEAMTRLP